MSLKLGEFENQFGIFNQYFIIVIVRKLEYGYFN